ncbi:MAG: 50S ribosomal protein L6, partial [Gammaproteobacteria bacterium]|nr:50S ribosomal protein L6 [Gammaproteobacteria bacterium]
MSRVANSPVTVPDEVEVRVADGEIAVKGSRGSLQLALTGDVTVERSDGVLTFAAAREDRRARAMAGTVRSLVNNMVVGVTEGF